MKVLSRICAGLETLCKILCICLFIVMTFSAFAQVVTRMIVGKSWGWTDEMCRYTLVWVSFIGAAYGVRKASHLKIDIVLNAIPKKAQKIFEFLSCIIELIVAVFLVKYGTELCMRTFASRSTVLNLPIGGVYMVIPISGLLIFLFIIMELIELFSGKLLSQAKERSN